MAARKAAKPSVVDVVRSRAYVVQGVCAKAAQMYTMVMVALREPKTGTFSIHNALFVVAALQHGNVILLYLENFLLIMKYMYN